jgi:hypothetical protein
MKKFIPLFLGLVIASGACGIAQAQEGAPWPVCQPSHCDPCVVPSIKHAAEFAKYILGKIENRPLCSPTGCAVQN